MASKNIVTAFPEDRGRMIIENNEQSILNLMDPEGISRLLLQKGVINSNDHDHILLPRTPIEKSKVLIGKLLTCGPAGYKKFMNSLQESGTSDHNELFRILSNDDPIPSGLSVDDKLKGGSQKRVTEKLAEHEVRLESLEAGARDANVELEILRAEINKTKTELEETKKELKAREEDFKKTNQENDDLGKQIRSLEGKVRKLERTLYEQRITYDNVVDHQLTAQEKHPANQMNEMKEMKEMMKQLLSTRAIVAPQKKSDEDDQRKPLQITGTAAAPQKKSF